MLGGILALFLLGPWVSATCGEMAGRGPAVERQMLICQEVAHSLLGLPYRNPCDLPGEPGSPLLDRMRRGVFETVCSSAHWFDRFFGSDRFYDEAWETYGRVGLRVIGDEAEGLETDTRFRAHFPLPNVERRLSVFLGREDRERFVSDRDDQVEQYPQLFDLDEERDFLLGLGYRPVGRARQSLDLDAGVEVRFPMEPFVRGRYRRHWLAGGTYLVRFRETLFWQNQRGFGTTTGLDFERILGADRLLRLENRVTLEQFSDGVLWRSALTFFDLLGSDRAFGYQVSIRGETDDEVPVTEWGFRVTYRQRILREWLFGELLGGVTWPREHPGAPRDPALHLGVGFELGFGRGG